MKEKLEDFFVIAEFVMMVIIIVLFIMSFFLY